MLDNVILFGECLNHPTKNVDPVAREILNKPILEINPVIATELEKKNAEIAELLTKYAEYNKLGDKSHNAEIIHDLDECLNYDGMNFCPFSQYLMVHDVTYDMYLKKLFIEEKEYIIECYLEDRHQMYLNRGYSAIVFQVLMDNYSHKRKGSMGVEKLKKICEDFSIPRLLDENKISDEKYYILPDAGDNKIFDLILTKNHIKFEFRNTHQGKMPDALIKINDSFLIVEHKTLKTTGGGQDKQMTEIIDFVGWDERGIHYISFMDGILFNELDNPSKRNKIFRDKTSIIDNLKECPYNYFVNDYGFDKIMHDILKK